MASFKRASLVVAASVGAVEALKDQVGAVQVELRPQDLPPIREEQRGGIQLLFQIDDREGLYLCSRCWCEEEEEEEEEGEMREKSAGIGGVPEESYVLELLGSKLNLVSSTTEGWLFPDVAYIIF